MTDTPQLLLAHHLKALKLPTFLREYDKLARQCAAEGLDHIRFLLRLAELELIDRERRMVERRIKEARFPAVKSLDCFDFAAIPSLNKTLVLELARSEYVTRRENIIAVGNSGTGKTHVCLGLGLAACQKGLSVGFNTAAALVHELLEARDEKRLLRLQRQLAGCKLLIIDATWSHRYWTNNQAEKSRGNIPNGELLLSLFRLLGPAVLRWHSSVAGDQRTGQHRAGKKIKVNTVPTRSYSRWHHFNLSGDRRSAATQNIRFRTNGSDGLNRSPQGAIICRACCKDMRSSMSSRLTPGPLFLISSGRYLPTESASLDSRTKCNRAMRTGFARLCQVP